jgi:hypothetical protein
MRILNATLAHSHAAELSFFNHTCRILVNIETITFRLVYRLLVVRVACCRRLVAEQLVELVSVVQGGAVGHLLVLDLVFIRRSSHVEAVAVKFSAMFELCGLQR